MLASFLLWVGWIKSRRLAGGIWLTFLGSLSMSQFESLPFGLELRHAAPLYGQSELWIDATADNSFFVILD